MINQELKERVLTITGASRISDTETVQSLWSGYGEIIRMHLDVDQSHPNDSIRSVIVKYVQPPETHTHPRGWNTDTSLQRKLASYRVEANWYQQYAESSRLLCAMPRLFDSYVSDNLMWLILEDLDPDFPLRHQQLSMDNCKPCLRWLARFHGQHLHSKGEGLWKTGTYWHLHTRKDEFDAMQPGALKDAAQMLDARLSDCQFQSLVHGDAKCANVCFSPDNREVSMVDFQYVGCGCGIRDVAYFLGSALSGQECNQHAEALLDVYFQELKEHISNDLADSVEAEWRALYATAWADFHRFLAGWMPGHRKINDYTERMTQQALSQL